MVYPEKNSGKPASNPSTATITDNEDEFNESLDINAVDLSDADMVIDVEENSCELFTNGQISPLVLPRDPDTTTNTTTTTTTATDFTCAQRISQCTPLVSSPINLLNTAMRPSFNESTIDISSSNNGSYLFSDNNNLCSGPSIKRKLFDPQGLNRLVNNNSHIDVTPLLTQPQTQVNEHPGDAIRSKFIVEHLKVSEIYNSSDASRALINAYSGTKNRDISYIKPHCNAGKRKFDIVLSINKLAHRAEAIYINSLSTDKSSISFSADHFKESRTKMDYFFQETSCGKVSNTVRWSASTFKYSLMQHQDGSIVLAIHFQEEDRAAIEVKISCSDIPLFKRRLQTIWSVVDLLKIKREMRDSVLASLEKKYKDSSDSCKKNRFIFIFETYYSSLPKNSNLVPPIFQALENIISEDSLAQYL